ncbi:MAG: hypothetical protein AAFY71_10900 [Bacteroidota bacterium]
MPITIFVLSISILGLILYIIYLRNKYIVPNQTTANVQTLPKKEPPKDHSEAFLPGSKVDNNAASFIDELYEGLEENKKKRPRPFKSKADIRRAYIVDAILEKPKYLD